MEQRISIERMEEAVNLFGSFDENIRLLETEFQVQVVNRGGEIVVSGEPENVMLAVKAVQALLTLSNKGETITDQHVRYVIGLVRSGQAERISNVGVSVPGLAELRDFVFLFVCHSDLQSEGLSFSSH